MLKSIGKKWNYTPKVAFKDHSKPKVEEKGKLITNPTRCLRCNDLNGWIKGEDDDFQDDLIDEEEGNEDQEIDSFEDIEEGMSVAVYASPSTGFHATNSSACDRDASPISDLKTVQNYSLLSDEDGYKVKFFCHMIS
ncbi:hypothetical protein M9H77_07319 [Catharanthus roseus]|uniref:Uncharacterized protein n=1 Tax=Catharanthus roseus TaxID=4058 RepID=A0ACC0BUK5_CATRO|nr:hypothetical protein M9H77_07319 [Catharanthus roseus]